MGQILEHKHLIIRAELKNPPKCAEAIQDWMKLLVDKIDMKILMGPYAVYSDMVGNQGLTAVTISLSGNSNCKTFGYKAAFGRAVFSPIALPVRQP